MNWRLSALVLCLCALPANGQSLRGQWDIEVPNTPTSGIVLIDTEGRVTWDSPNDAGRPAKRYGYVDRHQAAGIRIVITNGSDVVSVYCAHETADKMQCYASRPDGKSIPFLLARVGPGPQNLTLAPR